MFFGGFSTFFTADFVAHTLEPYLCPDGSKAEIITYQTTTTDDFGNLEPATGYEMQCVDANGRITRESSPDYSFIWLGVVSVATVILTALLAFLLAAPAGLLIARLLRSPKHSTIDNSS